ncbi:protein of unknown function [Ferrithrix thermotolerans DSM 19514]|uniref:Uncharacterized protein n=1 Tax=Ferrithrix thermotolerans DSM 19514 TaxID=1121881 RepID=A0A1M4TYS5_9ACTN|nr:DUF2017 family protein [Ferrithrix thermotolerans]SHE49497.1 protein of unknown function [Ferrithrix thermotolerans DSM 19514]
MKSPFKRQGEDTIKVRINDRERDVLSNYLEQISNIVLSDINLSWRLFPPIFDDPVRQAECELDSQSREDAKQFEVASSFSVSAEMIRRKDLLNSVEATTLLQDLNKARLVLAEILGIKDESFNQSSLGSDELRFIFDVYNYLGWIVSELIETLAS